MSRPMGKPTICIGENKGADQLCGNREADYTFVFATWIVQFLFYLNPKEALTISIQKCLWFLEKQKAGHLCSYAQVNFLELCTIG